MRPAVPSVSLGSDPRSAQHGQAVLGDLVSGEESVMIRTLVMARHFGVIFFFISQPPHKKPLSFPFLGEETETQTSEEKYPRLSDRIEIQIQVWTAKPMSFSYHA